MSTREEDMLSKNLFLDKAGNAKFSNKDKGKKRKKARYNVFLPTSISALELGRSENFTLGLGKATKASVSSNPSGRRLSAPDITWTWIEASSPASSSSSWTELTDPDSPSEIEEDIKNERERDTVQASPVTFERFERNTSPSFVFVSLPSPDRIVDSKIIGEKVTITDEDKRQAEKEETATKQVKVKVPIQAAINWKSVSSSQALLLGSQAEQLERRLQQSKGQPVQTEDGLHLQIQLPSGFQVASNLITPITSGEKEEIQSDDERASRIEERSKGISQNSEYPLVPLPNSALTSIVGEQNGGTQSDDGEETSVAEEENLEFSQGAEYQSPQISQVVEADGQQAIGERQLDAEKLPKKQSQARDGIEINLQEAGVLLPEFPVARPKSKSEQQRGLDDKEAEEKKQAEELHRIEEDIRIRHEAEERKVQEEAQRIARARAEAEEVLRQQEKIRREKAAQERAAAEARARTSEAEAQAVVRAMLSDPHLFF